MVVDGEEIGISVADDIVSVVVTVNGKTKQI